MSMYDLTPIGDNLFTCDKCGVVVKSGFMNIYRHSLVCGTFKPWPIDPNAPKNTIQEYINKGYQLVVDSHAGAHAIRIGGKYADIIVISADSEILLTDEEIAKLKTQRIVPPIPIVPLPELKELKNQIYIKEDNRSSSGKVSPREQKNRERFMKRRK